MVRCSIRWSTQWPRGGARVWLAGAALGLGSSACTGSATQCEVGSECPSGACRADGTCVPVDTDDGGSSGTGFGTDAQQGSTTDAAETTAAEGSTGATAETGGNVGCLPPNEDGLIERDEVFLEAGLSATYLVATDVPVNTQGTTDETGLRHWDFDVELAGDHMVTVETLDVQGRWFEPLFPGATYAAQLSASDDLLGVFEATPTALLLRGVVSPDDGLMRTELTYDPPVSVLRFPLQMGAQWETTSTVSGLAQGVAAFYSETYASEVDAEGSAQTPFGPFPVQRVDIELTRTVGALVTTTRRYAFVAECFGTVASIASMDNEQAAEFTQASEIRRLTP